MSRKPMMDAILTTGQCVRRLRKRQGITLQALSNRLGVSKGYLSQVERDNAAPTRDILMQIAQAFHVGIDYFVVAPRSSNPFTRARVGV